MKYNYDLPEIQMSKYKLEDITNAIESRGFEFINVNSIQRKTEGDMSGLVYPGGRLEGNLSFILNEQQWLMYEKKRGNLRDIVFLSEDKDLIVKKNDSGGLSKDVTNLFALDKVLKEYASAKEFFHPQRIYIMDLFESGKIGIRYNNNHSTSMNFGVVMGGIVTLSTLLVTKVGARPDKINELLLGLGVGIICGAGAYIYQHGLVKENRNTAQRHLDKLEKSCKENNYVLGENALRYVAETENNLLSI